MKVLAINGSPRKNGNTNQVLEAMGEVLKDEGIDFEILHIGNRQIRGCVACDGCLFSETHRCVMADDAFTLWLDAIEAADGLILGSPAYFGNIPGTFKCFLDRAFCGHGYIARNKVGAAITVLRRTGGSNSYAQLLNYITTGAMILAPSTHWNAVHGAFKGEAQYDAEGMAAARYTARSMAWLMKSLEKASLPPPPLAGGFQNVTNLVRDDLKG